ncbi:hypothetical protein LOTGIDRAFT_161973 [Lottia gigantea]|uniref:Uncharacterized protein n=1 Tax=Lottia gigantea TaxID=225164 RepID=V4AIU5_LOTGI|nr:hypothetical protein LOTGIDRAFT_161973 [Lottia gigantea]ESO93401.1 hypothetical protein LOTGIDRAFT_161973 [Lottia gigantea]
MPTDTDQLSTKTIEMITNPPYSKIPKDLPISVTQPFPISGKTNEELYHISCPKQKFLTVRRNDYLGCSDDGKVRFDLYGATVQEVTFAVPHPSIPKYRRKRSSGSKVLWEDGYPRENCTGDGVQDDLRDDGISQPAAGGSLPVTIYPKRMPYLNLAFKMSSEGLNVNKNLQPVFTIGACCNNPSNISMTAINSDSNTAIHLGEQEFQPSDTTKFWVFPVISSWDDHDIEIHVDFSRLQQPILLNYMKFEIRELNINEYDSPNSPEKTLLCETEEVKVEGMKQSDESAPTMKFRLNGSTTTTDVSRMMFSPFASGSTDGTRGPSLVLDSSGSCTFNPSSTVDVSESTAFILGSTNPTQEPKIAIEEVELEPDVTSDNTSVILHLLGASFGQSTIRLKVTPTETRLTLLQVVPIGKPLSSFFIPCDGKDTTFSTDGADSISINEPWKGISGEKITIRR